MKTQPQRSILMVATCLLAACTCPDSFREVPTPQVRQVADVARVSDCQMKHYGATLLAKADSADMVRALVKAGADVHGRVIANNKLYPGNPLVQATGTEVLRELLRSGADVNARGGADDATPLCDAIRKRQHEKAKLLLQAGAHPSLADSKGETPLHMAATRGDTDMCRQLLIAGAHVDAGLLADGTSPILSVQKAAHGGKMPLADAEAIVQMLMDAGAQTDVADAEGNTLLHYATPGVVHRLLAAGLSPFVTNNLGRTPLFTSRDRSIVDALLGAGADIQARDGEGATAFDIVPSAQVKSYLLFRGCRSGRTL
ncbi:MAG: ankyrin repeat domain-containing protein [Akkermansia sp.]|nr:ankyrin repeat domain-containing protein [Akkermansia sp.]